MTKQLHFGTCRDVNGLQREFDRLFGAFAPLSDIAFPKRGASAPSTDMVATDDALQFYLDLPGVSKENVEIHVRDHALHVEGERPSVELGDGHTFRRRERSHGQFRRVFALPQAVASDAIEASFDNGVLHIRVPIKDELKLRKIPIQ